MPYTFLLIFLDIGVLGDAILSGISFLEIIGTTNIFTLILAIAVAILITGCTTLTKFIFENGELYLIIFWFLAFFLDVGSTVVGVAEFVGFNSSFEYFLTIVMAIYLEGAALMFSFVLED